MNLTSQFAVQLARDNLEEFRASHDYQALLADRDRLRAINAELLKALEKLVDQMQVVYSSGDPRPAQWFASRIAKARAAIAKAGA